MEPFGVIAGNGQLPQLILSALSKRGHESFVIAHKNETSNEVESFAKKIQWIRIGQLDRIIRFFKSNGVRRCLMIGGISRINLFKGGVLPDIRALKLIARIGSIRDDRLLRAIADELQSEGIAVESPFELLPECSLNQGVLTNRKLSDLELMDARVGWQAAEFLGRADVGQTVVVSGGVVVALEAVEGTDQCIARGATLARGPCVVVKISKPQQDKRLDLPTIGIRTIESLIANSVSALVVESQNCIVIDPNEVCALANKHNIAVVAFDTFEQLELAAQNISESTIIKSRYK